MKQAVFVALTGLFLGVSLSRIGFSSWDQVHAMFTFRDLRLIFAFAFAVVLLAVAWKWIAKTTGASWSPRNIHKGTVAGGALFGAGWALSGACPSIALVQLGELQLGAVVTLIGIFLGNYLYAYLHERYFRWSTNNCLDD